MNASATEAFLNAIHGITAQLEEIRRELFLTRRALGIIAEYMPGLCEYLSALKPEERQEPYADHDATQA